MAAKALLVLCASALFAQTISAQCIGALNSGITGYGNGLANNLALAEIANAGIGGCGYGIGPVLNAAPFYAPGIGISANGGGLAVSSASPISPNGITVVSENAIEGILDVAGQLPLLAAVGLEGALPTAGAAGVTYSCGNGQVGIASESLTGAGYGNNVYGAVNAAELAGLNAGLSYGNQIGLANAGLVGLNGIRGCGCGIY